MEEKILFRVESHIFAGEGSTNLKVVQISMTKADLFLRIFEAILWTFETL